MLTGYQILNRVQQLVAGIALAANAWSGIKQASDYASFAAAVAAIGATPTMLNITEDAAISSAVTVPSTLLINPVNGAKLVWASGGSLVFEGAGLTDPMSSIPVFSGFVGKYFYFSVSGTGTGLTLSNPFGGAIAESFAASDVGRFIHIPSINYFSTIAGFTSASQATVTDSLPSEITRQVAYIYDLKWAAPPVVSTGLVDSPSLTQQLRTLTAALAGREVDFHCHEAEITAGVAMMDRHSLYFLPGDFQNSVNTHGTSYARPFTMGSHSNFRSAPGAIIYESNVDNNVYLVETKPGAENAIVEKNYFLGQGAAGDGASGGVAIVAGYNCHTRNNYFENCHSYNTTIVGAADNAYSEYCTIDGNHFVGHPTQMAHIAVARKWGVINNIFEMDGLTAGSWAPIDIESNTGSDVMEDGLIDGNWIDVRGTSGNCSGILVQGFQAGGEGNQRITISNNRVLGMEVNDSPQETHTLGMVIYGWEGVEIFNNRFEGVGTGIKAYKCRYGNVRGNTVLQSGDVFGTIDYQGVADFDTYDNTLNRATHPTLNLTTIVERAINAAFTSSGSTVTGELGDVWYPLYEGLKVQINRTVYTIDEVSFVADGASPILTTTASVGTWANKTISNVNTTDNEITAAGHGFAAGARVRIDSTLTLPGGLPAESSTQTRTVFAIPTGTDRLKLAHTEEEADAGTAIDITNAGTGTLTLKPIMSTYFENNTYFNNKCNGGTWIESPVLSKVLGESGREIRDSLAPAQITVNTNDYAPGQAYRYDLSADASRNITGLALRPSNASIFTPAHMDGEKHLIYNAGAQSIVLKHEDSNSTATNRFKCSTAADITLAAGQAADIEYIANRWAVFKRN